MTFATFDEAVAIFGLAQGTKHFAWQLTTLKGTEKTRKGRLVKQTARLFVLVSTFSQCILYGLTRSTRVTPQKPDFEFGIVNGTLLAKGEKEIVEACSSLRPGVQVLFKQQRDTGVLQRSKDGLKLRLFVSFPQASLFADPLPASLQREAGGSRYTA